MHKLTLGLHLMLGLAASLALASRPAAAENFPTRPIRMIIISSPASPVDLVARTVSARMEAELGQPMIPDNQEGGAGTLGAAQLVRAPKDGYTVAVLSSSFVITPNLYPVRYNAGKDVTPVTLLTSSPMILTVNPGVPATDLAELLALAKARGSDKTLTFGSAGMGTSAFLCAELLAVATHTIWLSVPYRGYNQFVTDLVAGQIDMGFLAADGETSALVKAQKLRALGSSGPARAVNFPEVAPLSEQGIDGYDVQPWIAMVVPAGTPPAIIDRLNKAAVMALADPAVTKTLVQLGYKVWPTTPAQAAETFATDLVKYAKVIKGVGVKPE